MMSALRFARHCLLLVMLVTESCQPGESSLIYPKGAATPPTSEAPRPFGLDSVAPPLVPTTGGVAVTLAGSRFEQGMTILFDGIESPLSVVRSDTQVQALTPPLLGKLGRVSITIRSPRGDTVSRSDLLSYYAETISLAERHQLGTGPVAVAVGDLNGDGLPDAVTANIGSHDVSVLPGLRDGSFGQAVSYGVGQDPRALAIGDVNRDDRPDLVVANLADKTLSILLATDKGRFSPAVTLGIAVDPNDLALFDFDKDGALDILTVNSTQGAISIQPGNGDGTFRSPVSYPAGSGPIVGRLVDINKDGQIDVVVGNHFSRTVSVLLGSKTGSWSAPISSSMASFAGLLDLVDV